jgi:hypothetical protein
VPRACEVGIQSGGRPKGNRGDYAMSRLAELQRDIQDATVAVARAERTVAAHPDMPSVAATLRTIQKRRENLEGQFLAVTYEMGFDVCSYRIELPDDHRATIAGLTASLGSFQRIFTNVYNGIVKGIKKNSKVAADVIEATSLGFAYSFPGSVGVMMTIENERLLLDESNLDLAMKKTLELMSYSNAAEIQAAAEEVGLPAIRQVHQWASENAKSGYGVDVSWLRGDLVKNHIRIQAPQIQRLEAAIKVATARERVILSGDILDVSIPEKTFRMAVDDRTIEGGFDEAISRAHPVQMPGRYRATLEVRERVVAQEGEDAVTYFLLSLDPDG